jgi:phosphatidate cytidylyltransferase
MPLGIVPAMSNRLTYGAAAITALFAVILFDALISENKAAGVLGDLGRHGSLIPILFALLAFGGAVELGRLMRMAGLRPHLRWAVGWSVVLMLAPWLVSGLLLPHYPVDLSGSQWLCAVLVLALTSTALVVLPRKDQNGALADFAATWGIMVYAGFLPSFALQLRASDFLGGHNGAWLLLIFLAVVKVSDIGAFFIGSAIGRHRLIPWLSPKKSIEGALGGIATSITVALLFWFAYAWTEPVIVASVTGEPTEADRVSLLHTMTELFHSLTLSQVIIFAILMSVFGQLGDLLESMFKRAAGAKDSAHLLPAFGGILDIIDSPVLAAPIAWFVLTCLWPVV